MSKKMLYEVPDLSAYQGVVNMNAILESGCPAVILRAGYGQNNIDQRFEANARACYRLGMPVGIYWFSYALDVRMAEKEAEYALASAKGYWKECPIAYDLEYDTRRYAATKGIDIDRRLATDLVIAFLAVIAREGYQPVLYANRDFIKNYFDMERIRAAIPGVKLWFALYAKNIPASELEEADLWQYTAKGNLEGVSGKVDLNRVYADIFHAVTMEERPEIQNIYVKSFQAAANADGYRGPSGKKLVEDGIDGPKTRYVCRKIVLRAKQTEHGYQVGSTGATVRWLQNRLKEMGYAITADGKYGKNTRSVVIRFQKANHLAADGIAGYNTIQMMFYR